MCQSSVVSWDFWERLCNAFVELQMPFQSRINFIVYPRRCKLILQSVAEFLQSLSELMRGSDIHDWRRLGVTVGLSPAASNFACWSTYNDSATSRAILFVLKYLSEKAKTIFMPALIIEQAQNSAPITRRRIWMTPTDVKRWHPPEDKALHSAQFSSSCK